MYKTKSLTIEMIFKTLPNCPQSFRIAWINKKFVMLLTSNGYSKIKSNSFRKEILRINDPYNGEKIKHRFHFVFSISFEGRFIFIISWNFTVDHYVKLIFPLFVHSQINSKWFLLRWIIMTAIVNLSGILLLFSELFTFLKIETFFYSTS